MQDPYLYDDVKDIHRIIFGQIFEWTGKYRTIQMVKYEDVLGGDTVRERITLVRRLCSQIFRQNTQIDAG